MQDTGTALFQIPLRRTAAWKNDTYGIKLEEIQNYVQTAIEEMKNTLSSLKERAAEHTNEEDSKIESTVKTMKSVLAEVEEVKSESVFYQ